MRSLIVLISIYAVGCASLDTVQELDPETYYAPDIVMEIDDDKKLKGWGVIPYKESGKYELEFEAPGDIDLMKISTCARFDTDEPEGGIFKSDKKYFYKFRPNKKHELSGSCPLVVEAYEAGVPGRHSFGIYEIDGGPHTPESLAATVLCNAREKGYSGVSQCVTMEGMIQEVVFPVAVKLDLESISERCKIPYSADGMIWSFDTPNRECVYLFEELLGEKRLARHLSIGIEEVAVRRYR